MVDISDIYLQDINVTRFQKNGTKVYINFPRWVLNGKIVERVEP